MKRHIDEWLPEPQVIEVEVEVPELPKPPFTNYSGWIEPEKKEEWN